MDKEPEYLYEVMKGELHQYRITERAKAGGWWSTVTCDDGEGVPFIVCLNTSWYGRTPEEAYTKAIATCESIIRHCEECNRVYPTKMANACQELAVLQEGLSKLKEEKDD